MSETLEKQVSKMILASMDDAIEGIKAGIRPQVHTVIMRENVVVTRIETPQHKLFSLLIQLISLRQPVYLWGEAGSGKSTSAHEAAKALGLNYYYLALQAQTTESRLMGYMNATGGYVETDFYKAYTQGGVFLLDELELGNGNLLGSLNGALANGRASFPCGIVERHPDFVCIATGNTPALGATPAYSDRRALDGSVRERFAFVEWNTDEDFERTLAQQEYSNADKWVSWVQSVRKSAKSISPRLIVTQRASIFGAKFLNAGLQASQVADMLVWKGFDQTSIRSIVASHPVPVF